MNTPVTPQVGNRMSTESLTVLAYVASNANCTCAVLCEKFYPGFSSASVHSFRAKLNYLVQAGHLAVVFTDGVGIYQTGLGVKRSKPVPAVEKVAALVHVASRDRITPPAQYDRMHGPDFTYTLSQSTRPGALDFKRFTSRGDRC